MPFNQLENHAAIISKMVAEGNTVKEIIKVLRDLGCKLTIKALEKYLNEKGLKAKKTDNNPVFLSTEKMINSSDKKQPEIQKIHSRNFDFNSINLPDEFDSISLAEFLQKAHYFLYKRQLEIVANEQESYYLGHSDSQPIHSLRKLQILAELFYKIAPIHILSNQREAIKIIQRMGYTISIDGENINANNSTDSSTD